MSWLTKIKRGQQALSLLHRVHKQCLDGYLYSGPLREEVAGFLGMPVAYPGDPEPIKTAGICTREYGHSGPCNGMPCAYVIEKLSEPAYLDEPGVDYDGVYGYRCQDGGCGSCDHCLGK